MEFQLAHFDGAPWVIAQGRITETSDTDLNAYLSSIDAQPLGVVLNSHGGRLDGGLALGRAIRAEGLATRLTQINDCGDAEETPSQVSRCLSSCAYAFLGGVSRSVETGHQLGFHSFYPAAGQGEIAGDVLRVATARMMATLQAYVLDMGASPTLPQIAALVADDRVFVPRGTALSALGIETGPVQVARVDLNSLTQL